MSTRFKINLRNNFIKAKNINIMALSCRFQITNYGKDLFKEKIKNPHTNIRILIMDKDSELLGARLRDEDKEETIDKIKTDIDNTFKFFDDLS